jgi:ABC-2 type transport system permease protein
LKNEKRTIGMIFIAPIFAMFVFGLAFSGEVHDVKLIIVNQDQGYSYPGINISISISEQIISNLDPDVVDIEYKDDLNHAKSKVKDGDAYGVLYFPKQFSRDAFTKMSNNSYTGNTTMDLYLDKSNINVASEVSKTVSDALMKTIEDSGAELPITLNADNAIYGQDAEFIDFFVPGIMAFVVYLLTTLLTLITFVSERGTGTLDRLLTTPIKESEIVGGYAIAFSILGTIQASFLLIVGIILFDIMIVGNVLLAFAVIAILAISCQGLGILLSSLANREAQAVQFLPFIILPAFLLSGIFWPIEAIPAWLRPASYIVPPTYAVDACRGVFLKGWGIDMIWMDILALLAFAGFFMILAIFTLKRRRE